MNNIRKPQFAAGTRIVDKVVAAKEPITQKGLIKLLNDEAGKGRFGPGAGKWNQYNIKPILESLTEEEREVIKDQARIRKDPGEKNKVNGDKMVAVARAIRDIANQLGMSFTDENMGDALDCIISRSKWDPDWNKWGQMKAPDDQKKIDFEEKKVDEYYGVPE